MIHFWYEARQGWTYTGARRFFANYDGMISHYVRETANGEGTQLYDDTAKSTEQELPAQVDSTTLQSTLQ